MIVHEIFESISGEVSGLHQGVVCTFIRLSGCNLKCSYCDTEETQNSANGYDISVIEIVDKIDKIGNEVICITGGEPLLQMDVLVELCKYLKDLNYKIIIETNGTISPIPILGYVDSIVMDYKFEYDTFMHYNNYSLLGEKDVIKFVCADKKSIMLGIKLQSLFLHNFNSKAIFAFSPIMDHSNYGWNLKNFADILIKENKNTCVLSLQLHKVIGVK